ncbi:hypothetical protein ACFX2K_034443 [Malus domestica]
MQRDMIPFYFLSLLLIALPSTSTYVSYGIIRNSSSSVACSRYNSRCFRSSSGNQPPRESLLPPPPQSQSPPPQQSPLSLPPKPSPPLSPSPPPSLPILLTNRSGSSKPSSMIIIVGTLGSVAFCSLVVGCFFRKRLRTVKERYHSKRQKKKGHN